MKKHLLALVILGVFASAAKAQSNDTNTRGNDALRPPFQAYDALGLNYAF